MLKECSDSFSFCNNDFDCYQLRCRFNKKIIISPNGRRKFYFYRKNSYLPVPVMIIGIFMFMMFIYLTK